MRSSRIASRATSRGWPGSHTRGITSTASWARSRRRRGSCWRAPCARCSPTVSPSWGFAPRIGCSVGLLVVGSIALDSVATPFGETADAPGGSAVFFSAAGAILHNPVQVVGVVGSDYPWDALRQLEARGVDLTGVERAPGEPFRWEARELPGAWKICRASQWTLSRGPTMTVIKLGEQGAPLGEAQSVFKVPAYPLQEVFDPTGAGDACAGGFMGYLAKTGDRSPANLRRAMVYGAAMGSFGVEKFGIQGFEGVTLADVRARVRGFKELVHFEVEP